MGQILRLTFLFVSTWSFAQPDFSKVPTSTDSTYGYTDTNPLEMKKGNPGKSIGYSYDFLSSLVTQDNKGLRFLQRHTVANPATNNPETQLDKYIFVTHEKKDTVTIYVDIHSKGDLRIPIGLRYKYD